VLRVFLGALETLQRRSAGDWSPDKRLDTLPPSQPIETVLKANRPSIAESKAPPSAKALFEAYCLRKKSAPSTVSRWRPVFAALDALPEPVADRVQAQAWLDGLQTPDRSARTVHDVWLSAARTVYRWALGRRLIKSNPFEGCVVEVPRQVITRETGRAFTEAEARTVLRAARLVPLLPIGAKGSEWAACRRWVPFLCAYTGARVREMTQLRAGDVEQRLGHHGPLWVLKVTPEAGTVKTGKARAVPVHPHLVEMGFPEFAVRVKAALGPEAPLFFKPPQRPSRNPLYRGPAVKARERLAAWVREQGVDDPGISPNHAWRHVFKARARRAGIESGIRDAIVGHAARSTAESYEHVTVVDMAEALKQFPRYTVAEPPHGGKR
jgi:integrase